MGQNEWNKASSTDAHSLFFWKITVEDDFDSFRRQTFAVFYETLYSNLKLYILV